MTENKKDRIWVVEVTIVEKYLISAPTVGDAVLAPRKDPFFVDHIQTRVGLQEEKKDSDDKE